MGVCILPGARLGDGCVVGAGSVVTGELEPNSVVVGNPARAIRSR
jgi:virginiamycin A acetyltransferase